MGARRPKLTPRISVSNFKSFYWLKEELVAFAREHGLGVGGKKLEIAGRIERFLKTGKRPATRRRMRPRGRDSGAGITCSTRVDGWVCDAATRAFFEAECGPGFHFTVALNRMGKAAKGKGLTYGDLVDAWRAEKERRKDPNYKPRLGKAGEYNRYVRAFFADPRNAGKALEDAVAGWNRVKNVRGPRVYDRKRGW